MRRNVFFAIFIITIFMLTSMNQVVSASTIEVERQLQIEADPSVEYASVLNIINQSNAQFTNYEQLVNEFEVQSGISGGYTGSFLPPAKMQLNGGNASYSNNKLHLVSFVEFNRKTLLSGSSVSWWRCPYYFNGSNTIDRNWNLELTIYHTDMPRKENLSFEKAGVGLNYPVVPTNYGHPSIVFTKSYSNCGDVANNGDSQFTIDKSITIQKNDTLVNQDLPYNETSNPYLYYDTLNYYHTWFNVTAPVYPNSSYMAVWSISDLAVTTSTAGSFWITATDIGDNYYGRSLICFNNRTVYEMPIDLDTSIIFQYGLGDGVAGTKLQTATAPNYASHTSSFSDMSFENKQYYLASTFDTDYTSSGWLEGEPDPTETQVSWNSGDQSVDYTTKVRDTQFATITNNGLGGALTSSLGQNLKLEISMKGITYPNTLANSIVTTSAFQMTTMTTLTETMNLMIVRRSFLQIGVTYYDNFLRYRTGSSSFDEIQLPDNLPENLYITVLNNADIPTPTCFIYIFDKNTYATPIFTLKFYPYQGAGLFGFVTYAFSGGAYAETSTRYSASPYFAGTPNGNWYNVVSLKQFSSEAMRTTAESWIHQAGTEMTYDGKINYYPDAYETTLPDYNPVNTNAYILPDRNALTNHRYELYQERNVAITNKLVYFNVNYKLSPSIWYNPRSEQTLYNTTFNSYAFIRIEGFPTIGSVIPSATKQIIFNNWDGSWNEASTYIFGTFAKLKIVFGVHYQGFINPIYLLLDYKHAVFDSFSVESISTIGQPYHKFHQEFKEATLNSTNYYTLMIPIKSASGTPPIPPIAYMIFKDINGVVKYTQYTAPIDFYDDFILLSIKSSELTGKGIKSVEIDLWNYMTEAYMFLVDKNSDFNFNTKTQFIYNTFAYISDTGSLLKTNFFAPYFSLGTTEGKWVNSESGLTVTYFYFVNVYFVKSSDNDFEILSVKFDDVAVEDFEVYRLELTSFGSVYTAEEWLSYLEFRNRPSFLDKIVDAFGRLIKWFAENTVLGKILMAIGKFVVETIEFLAPYLEALGNFILEAFVFIIAIMIYFMATWVMWNFTKFWILMGQNKPQEALNELTSFTSKVTSYAKSGVGVIGKIGTMGKGG